MTRKKLVTNTMKIITYGLGILVIIGTEPTYITVFLEKFVM